MGAAQAASGVFSSFAGARLYLIFMNLGGEYPCMIRQTNLRRINRTAVIPARNTHRTMRRSWVPELDAQTVKCMKELPWWSGYDERAAVSRMLWRARQLDSNGGSDDGGASSNGAGSKAGGAFPAAAAVRPEIPVPLPHITAAYFGKVLRPGLHKCPAMGS